MKKDRVNKLILLIFLIALIIRILFIYSIPIKWWDETVYSNLAYDLSKNSLDYSFNNSWSDFIPSGNNLNYAWPHAGFRAPLLPYFLSIFYFLKLSFLIEFIIPLIGSLSIILIYLIGKKLFNEKTGLYSAILLCLIPLHINYSSKILTDVFFTFLILLTVLFYWQGFEEKKNKYKLLFGLFLGLSILTRYNGLWFIPIFGLHLLIRNKLGFLKDKYAWLGFILMLLTLLPLFIYSYLTYGNPLGSFIHGSIASSYWGGLQDYVFFFKNWYSMFSIIGFVFLISLFYLIYSKNLVKKEITLLLIWTFLFFLLAIIMPHKEDRLLLPIVPSICLITSYFLTKLKKSNWILFIILLVCLFFIINSFLIQYNNYNNTNSQCFKETTNYLNKIDKNSIIISENPPIFYYYTKLRQEYYPYPIDKKSIMELANKDNKIYFVFTKLNSGMTSEEFTNLKEILNKNFYQVFNCSMDPKDNFVYANKLT